MRKGELLVLKIEREPSLQNSKNYYFEKNNIYT